MPSMTRALAASAHDVQLTLTVYMYCWGFAGAASSLLSFVQFVTASTAALAVGIAFDGTSRAMATVTAIGAVCAFVAFRVLIAGRP